MIILIDLDGTILNSVHPWWKPYKEGKEGYYIDSYLDRLPFFSGAKNFLESQKEKGNSILIVSDSHSRYVRPICEYLHCDFVYLADKPNKSRLFSFLDSHPHYKDMVQSGDGIVIGDTVLDIELGRKIGLPTIWILPYQITKEIKNDIDKVGDEMACLKMGPTYSVRTFDEIHQIIDNPIENLYAIESSFAGGVSTKAIKYSQNIFSDKSYAAIRCLARQESGICDKYARADKYYLISNPNRPPELLITLANEISRYINLSNIINQGWDYITYLTDKQTTIPHNKMKEIFDNIETSIPKVSLFTWSKSVEGSLRNMNIYSKRKDFLEKYLSIDPYHIQTQIKKEGELNIKEKNIIVIDDQLTTSATAWHIIHQLKKEGVKNILFIALFQMILPVESDIMCPRCGKNMLIKIRRIDGHKFYSCTMPQFGGDGCGYIMNITNQ